MMRPSIAFASHREEIRCIVSENRGLNPGIFGFVLHGRDSETSDLDLLVDPASETSLLNIARIQARLEDLSGVHVDVLTPLDLPIAFRGKVVSEAISL